MTDFYYKCPCCGYHTQKYHAMEYHVMDVHVELFNARELIKE